MQGGDLLAQGQPQAEPALLPAAGLVHPVERLCQVVQGLRRDAPAIVHHLDAAAVGEHVAPVPDVPAVDQGLLGVVRQVQQQRPRKVRLQMGHITKDIGYSIFPMN